MIYVDDVRFRFGRMIMCHMWTDGPLNELHEFAARLGLKRAWFQERPKAKWDHYDISLEKRRLAVKLGARQTDRFGALEFVLKQRLQLPLPDEIKKHMLVRLASIHAARSRCMTR